MDYTQFYCKECQTHGYDALANGVCYHPEVDMQMDGNCRACFRFKLKGDNEQGTSNETTT